MHAQVAPREELLAGTPHDEVLAEQPGCNRSTVCKVRDERYGVPIVHEDWIVNHHYSSSVRARCVDANPPKMCHQPGPNGLIRGPGCNHLSPNGEKLTVMTSGGLEAPTSPGFDRPTQHDN